MPPMPFVPPVAGLVAALALAACDFGEITTYELEGPGAVSFEVRAVTPDTAVAQALGWSGVSVPGAQVRLELEDDDGSPWSAEATTDEAGFALFDQVPVGFHTVSVERELSPDEREAAAQQGALALLTETRVQVSGTSTMAEVLVPASICRSLVISEFAYATHLHANQVGTYNAGGFIELYNNSDTTIYLDGKVVGSGFDILIDFPPPQTCVAYEPLRVDPGGIWAQFWERFPGSGTDHPVAPGETVVIATDAIDHRPFAPTAPDLRGADFEFRGPADVSNPGVTDMIPDGVRPNPSNRGLFFPAGRGVAFIADPVVTAELDRMPFLFDRTWARIPVEALLDVVVIYEDDPLFPEWPLCPQVSHPSINRGASPMAPNQSGLTVHRRILTILPDGRPLLQHTRTSPADMVIGPPSPGAPGPP
jgi:hypothetical protein